MLKTNFTLIVVAILSLLVAACGGTDTQEAKTSEAGEVAEAVGGTAFTINPTETTLKWTGSKPAYNHAGNVKVKSGSLTLENGTITEGHFIVDLTSISAIADAAADTEEKTGKLVGHLMSDQFFNVEQYPTAKFDVTNVSILENDANENTHMVAGNLTIRDKTNEIEFPAKVNVKDGKLYSISTFKIDRSKWDVKYNSTSFPAFANLAADQIISNDIEFVLTLVADEAK